MAKKKVKKKKKGKKKKKASKPEGEGMDRPPLCINCGSALKANMDSCPSCGMRTDSHLDEFEVLDMEPVDEPSSPPPSTSDGLTDLGVIDRKRVHYNITLACHHLLHKCGQLEHGHLQRIPQVYRFRLA